MNAASSSFADCAGLQPAATASDPSSGPHVLIVDDDRSMRIALETRFLRMNWRVETAASGAEALGKFRRVKHPLIVSDIRMPGDDGFSVLRAARALAPQTAVILLTAFASVPEAVLAIKDGACEYLMKPVSFEQLEQAAARVLNHSRQMDVEDGLAGRSTEWLRTLDRARQAAATGADILIEAESGTGKELVARMIHRLSPRRERPFVAVNCAAFPETLLESELFGHAKGAFTGADRAKPGRFELAQGGTLLLDEVGEMPLVLQPKLLRVLQEREFDRLGDTRTVQVDLRVIATTNRSLRQMVTAGQFRADLYYRLNVIALTLPPLREREGDIRELAHYFAARYSPAFPAMRLTEDFLKCLDAHAWPGNVRELANCLRRVTALAPDSGVGPEALESYEWTPRLGPAIADAINSKLEPGLKLGEMERRLFAMTLAATGGNRSRAAEMLGVSLRTVRNKVRSYGLPRWEAGLASAEGMNTAARPGKDANGPNS
ncbi:MAG TPA: sigma-54 dependent transcriptional regulator [Candidatus Sulfotelmatobacter sp.]